MNIRRNARWLLRPTRAASKVYIFFNTSSREILLLDFVLCIYSPRVYLNGEYALQLLALLQLTGVHYSNRKKIYAGNYLCCKTVP